MSFSFGAKVLQLMHALNIPPNNCSCVNCVAGCLDMACFILSFIMKTHMVLLQDPRMSVEDRIAGNRFLNL